MRKKAEEDLRKTKNENEKKNIYSFLNSSFYIWLKFKKFVKLEFWMVVLTINILL